MMMGTNNNIGISGEEQQQQILPYSVVGCSSYSSGYRPEFLQEDNPTDQASRWSSASNDQNQYVILRLEKPSLLRTFILKITLVMCAWCLGGITFGKFHKNHVCNLREFKVFVTASEDLEGDIESTSSTIGSGKWIEVLHSGLRNDNEAETFPLIYPQWSTTNNSNPFPVNRVKIQPLAAWGNSFNFSIWFVQLKGCMETFLVNPVQEQYSKVVLNESWRLILKFLRDQPEMSDVFDTLLNRDKVPQLESPLATRLYNILLTSGQGSSYYEAEMCVSQAYNENPLIFDEFIREKTIPIPIWTRLNVSSNRNGSDLESSVLVAGPRERGGHQMCWDGLEGVIYLLGGWDGNTDLGDFWKYSPSDNIWTCLSEDTRQEGGPGARSCHKMLLHTGERRLYVLGKYVDSEERHSQNISNLVNDFYYYDLERNTWTCLQGDVKAAGGPSLMYDHQMAIDEDRNILYVFGGRLITNTGSNTADTLYSGLYSYDITANFWRLIRSDADFAKGTTIKSRIGHSMVFNPITRHLIIYAGQRLKDYLCDFYLYDVDQDMVVEMVKDTSKVGGPDSGFTQRPTLDVQRQELFLLSGLMRERSTINNTPSAGNNQATPTNATTSTESPRNTLWMYKLNSRRWIKIGETGNNSGSMTEPCPRFAHQLVYDPAGQVHYMFGGNPGDSAAPRRRLNDLWSLYLAPAMSSGDVLRRIGFLLRRQNFYDLCRVGDMVNAMRYLQQDVAAMVRHDDVVEGGEFRALSSCLLQKMSMTIFTDGRKALFNEIISYLPLAMRPPQASLSHALNM